MKARAFVMLVSLSSFFTACTTPRIKVYQDMLDPMVGAKKKEDVNRKLGRPTTCTTKEGGEECEYRTAAGRNEVIPETASKVEGMGPDLSPYEYFDVLNVYYDDMGTVKDWEAVVVRP